MQINKKFKTFKNIRIKSNFIVLKRFANTSDNTVVLYNVTSKLLCSAVTHKNLATGTSHFVLGIANSSSTAHRIFHVSHPWQMFRCRSALWRFRFSDTEAAMFTCSRLVIAVILSLIGKIKDAVTLCCG